MSTWRSLLKHQKAYDTVEELWRPLFTNLILALLPLVFFAPLPVTLVSVSLCLLSYFMHVIKKRIPFILTIPFIAFILFILRSSLPGGAFSPGFVIACFAVVAVAKSFYLRYQGDAQIFLIFVLTLNASVVLLDGEDLLILWSTGITVLTVVNLLRINIKNFSSVTLLSSLRSAAQVTIYVLPLLFFLIFIFHRFTNHRFYWGNGGVTGISESMEPGQISQIALNNSVALRIFIDRPELPFNGTYWKGLTLWNTKGGLSWHSGTTLDELTKNPTLAPKGNQSPCLVKQTIFSQKTDVIDQHYGLDVPIHLDRLSNGGYQVVSDVCEVVQKQSAKDEFTKYTKFETPPSAKVRQLALALKEMSKVNGVFTTEKFVDEVLHYFATNSYKYTLTPGRQRNSRSLEEFLFNSKTGFCEHYAGAFASLMRLAGVPSRVVVGFQGGTYNRYGGYWTVSMKDAHAWDEVFLPRRGWIRVDPTAVVSHGILGNEQDGFLAFLSSIKVDEAKLLFDALFFRVNLFFKNRDTLISFKDITANPWLLVSLLCFLMILQYIRRDPFDFRAATRGHFRKLCELIGELGLPRGRSEGFDAYRTRVLQWIREKSSSVDANLMNETFNEVINFRYGSQTYSREDLKQLDRKIKYLHRELRKHTGFRRLFWGSK